MNSERNLANNSSVTILERTAECDDQLPDYFLSVTARDLDERKLRWEQEKLTGEKSPQSGALEPQNDDDRGLVVEVVGGAVTEEIACDRAQGIVSVTGNELLVASHGAIKMFFGGTPDQIYATNRMFNDIHSLRITEGGGTLITSTGTDAIFELDASGGEVVWSWFATNHGYTRDYFGNERTIDKARDHRFEVYDTWENTTHVNSAIKIGSSVVLATLFHQGKVIAINQDTGNAETLVTGLGRPHALRITPEGSISLANTTQGLGMIGAHEIGRALTIESVTEFETNWLQDFIAHGNLRIGVDGENSRVIFAKPDGRVVGVDQYPSDYVLYDIAIK